MDQSLPASLDGPPTDAFLAAPFSDPVVASTSRPEGREPVVAKGKVTFRNKGVRREATFVVSAGVMTMNCKFGTFKASAGCGDPRKFARTLLRSLCRRFERMSE